MAAEGQPDTKTNGSCDTASHQQKPPAADQPEPPTSSGDSPAEATGGKQLLKREPDVQREPEEATAKKKKKKHHHHHQQQPQHREDPRQQLPVADKPTAPPAVPAELDDANKNGHSPDQHMMLLTAAQPRRKLVDLMYIEKHTNGGGLALHAYAGELARLDRTQLAKFALLFLKNLLVKERGKPGRMHSNYCVGVVHGAAHDLPDLLSELCRLRPHLTVKSRHLEKKNEVESLTVEDYLKRIRANYSHGTFRSGAMESVSMVGAKGEETGCLMTDMLAKLESNPFLAPVMPWGPMSRLAGSSPSSSNDGPILWTRPGEQALSSGSERSRGDSLSQMYSTGSRGRRQVVITDRTHAHADHADDGLDRHTTAAVGLLQCVHADEHRRPAVGEPGRVCKDAILFDPRHYTDLIVRLQLDILEPPMTQCSPQLWLDDAELNLLRREGFRYSRQQLRDNDIYYIPRGVVHQFRTVSAVTSVAWHVRMAAYYPELKQEQEQKQDNNDSAAANEPDSAASASTAPNESVQENK